MSVQNSVLVTCDVMVGLSGIIASAESSRKKLKHIYCLHERSKLNGYEQLIEPLCLIGTSTLVQSFS
jgi:hypothetical protein